MRSAGGAGALLGAQQLLPKHGAFSPTPMEARLGAPVDPHATTAAELRRRVVAMRDEHPIRQRQSQIWSATARLVTSRYGLLMAFLWGFAEALSWPIIAEMALVVFAAAVPRRVMPWTAALAAGSVLGVLTTALLASRGVLLPAPLTTTRMAATAYDQLAAGPSAMLHQAFSGIPVKVYARAAGQHHIGMWKLAGWTLLERGARIAVLGLAIRGVSAALHPWLPPAVWRLSVRGLRRLHRGTHRLIGRILVLTRGDSRGSGDEATDIKSTTSFSA